jgi:hypothetical protein
LIGRIQPVYRRLAAIRVSSAIEPAQGEAAASMQFRQKAITAAALIFL